jgi:hypothetical protein
VAVGLNTCSFAGERLFALPRGCAEKWRLRVLATQHLSAHHRDIRGLRAAFGHDSCLQSTFEGESRLTAAQERYVLMSRPCNASIASGNVRHTTAPGADLDSARRRYSLVCFSPITMLA